jgi:type I restriction enzyme S subunit
VREHHAWSRLKVKDLITSGALSVNDGYRVTNIELGTAGVPFVRGGDIGDGWINTDVVDRILPEFEPRVQSKLSQSDDVAFISKGNVGRVGRLRPGQPRVVFSPQVCYWRVNDREVLDPRFLYYLLRGPQFQAELDAVKTHGSMVADYVSLADQRNFHLLLPPTNEQREISSMLGTLDDRIDLNRRMNQTLEAMARAIFKSWFVDFDPVIGGNPLFPKSIQPSSGGIIPIHWAVGNLEEYAEFILGGDWGSDTATESTPSAALCIRGADIPSLQQGGTGKMPIRYLKSSSLAKRSLRPGDLVIEVSGGSPTQSTGRPVLITRRLLDRLPYPLVCSNFCRMLRPKSQNSATFFYLWLLWLYANDEFLQYENGTTGIKNLAFASFAASHRIVMPPPEVLAAFGRMIGPLFDKQQQSGVESETLAAIRDALLPKLLSGEIRVKQAEKIVGEVV